MINNILVVNVSLRPTSKEKMFPIGLGFITTAMKNAGFEFDILDIDANRYCDDEVEELIASKEYSVVCMGCVVTGYKKIKQLCSVIKRHHPNSTIIIGNSVATSIPGILLCKTQADIAVMGEGDITIIELLDAIKQNKNIEEVAGIVILKGNQLFYTPKRSPIKDISSLPFIDYEIFGAEEYIKNNNVHQTNLNIDKSEIRALPVNTARGCIAKCTFCYHVFKEMGYRYRSAESIVSEIESLVNKYSLNHIQFWDELTFFSKKQALELAERIIRSGLKINWMGSVRSNLFTVDSDIEIVEKLKEAGCCGVQYSLESSDTSILKSMNKKIKVDHFNKQTKLFQSVGITTWTSLVFGYPQETVKTINATIDCCIENNMYPSVGFILPQPDSAMYKYALDNGYIIDEEEYILSMGDRQDLSINLTSMSDYEFENAVAEGLKRCNRELKIGLPEDKLIKTTKFMRNAKK